MKPKRLLTFFAATVAATVFTSSAHAATYAVDSCQRPDGSPVGTPGWTSALRGAFIDTVDSCSGGGGLTAAFNGATEHNYTDFGSWTLTAPSGTALERLTAIRSARAGADQAFGSPVALLGRDSATLESCLRYLGCSSLDGPIDFALNGSSTFRLAVECGGAGGGRCPADVTRMSLSKIRLTLSDEKPPVLARAAAGSLTSSSSRARVRTLSYNATDVGSGLFRERILVDGAERLNQQIDNSATCQRHPAGGFSAPRPCPLGASRDISYDTGGLSDGEHTVQLEVYDATESNKTGDGPWTITVDNQPPTVGEVAVSGAAQEGQALRCSAPLNGQGATASYAWFRSNADGSGATAIPGATAASFTLTAAEVGKKVLCRVTGTDGGGSDTRTSSVTSGPFANDAVVAPAPPAPTGGDGSTSGTGGSAEKNVALAAAAAGAGSTCSSASVTMFNTATSLRRSYNRSRVSLSGRLDSRDGSPVGGRVLEIVQTVARSGSVQRKTLGSVRTKQDGRFRTSAPPGPSRALQLVEKGCGSVGQVITERVRGAISSRTTTKRVRNRQSARIKGRVLGGYVGRGIPVELQVKVGRKWRDVKHTTTNSRGVYKISYRFTRTYVRYTYRFRVVTRAGGSWPFLPAKSKTVKVRVN